MSVGPVIAQLLEAQDLGALQLAVRRLCSQFGVVRKSEVLLSGSFGTFCAFCTVQMAQDDAHDQLMRYGFKRLGDRAYLAMTLPEHFERRTAVRAA